MVEPKRFAAKAIQMGAIAPAYPYGGSALHLVRLKERRGRAWTAEPLCTNEAAKTAEKWFPYPAGEEPDPAVLCRACQAASPSQGAPE